MNKLYPLFYDDTVNNWQVLDLPIVDKTHAVPSDMTMHTIKTQISWKLEYNIEEFVNSLKKYYQDQNESNLEEIEAGLENILKVINVYLIFFDPAIFYGYNCYLRSGDYCETTDPYWGYSYLFTHDLTTGERAFFIQKAKKAKEYFEQAVSYLLTGDLPETEASKIKNHFSAITLALEDVLSIEQNLLDKEEKEKNSHHLAEEAKLNRNLKL